MSSNSSIGHLGTDINQGWNDFWASGAKTGQGIASGQITPFGTKPTQSTAPDTPPPPPKPGDANNFALQGQLSYEQRQAAASTILTGGQGLTDEPTTASRVLLGS